MGISIFFATSSAYCIKYYSTDFDGAALAFMVAIGVLGLVYFMIAAILMRHQTDGIFTGLSTIYESSKFILVN